jgi:UTP--glucose-1-phosphate uridylyltransferase
VLSYQFEGKRHDCGTKQGYLQATVEFALKHPEVQEVFYHFLQRLPVIGSKDWQPVASPASLSTH